MKCAIVGASGAVGGELLAVLGKMKETMGVRSVRLFASARSAGKKLFCAAFGGEVEIEEFSVDKCKGNDYVFMAVSGGFAEKYAKILADNGSVVIDNSSSFRYDPNTPLVVPEINGTAALGHGIIANPNCTTAIAAMALWPLYQTFGIERLIISTYQASSGAGAEGMAELEAQAVAHVKGQDKEANVFQYPLMFNLIPHVDAFQENGYTREEMKVVWETRKIFGKKDLKVSCTCVRIPTLRAHAEAITIETVKPCDVAAAKKCIQDADGVELLDDPENKRYPMPLSASAKFDVECGRIRRNDVFGDKGLDIFVCGDQLLRGAALNAVLIAKYVQENKNKTADEPAAKKQKFES